MRDGVGSDEAAGTRYTTMTDIVSINPAVIGNDFLQRIVFSLMGIDLAVNTLLYAFTANTHRTNSKRPLSHKRRPQWPQWSVF